MEEILDQAQWLGHDGFLFRAGGKVVVFDPFRVKTSEPADLILISHGHHDHCSPEDVAKFVGKDTVVVATADCTAKLAGLGADVRPIAPGESLTVGGIAVKAIPAYNTDKAFHPRANGWVGFVADLGGVSVYHAGDTDLIPEMDGLAPDIALLPVSGTYVMTWEQAVEAARRIQPKVAVPMHYGGIVGTGKDAENFEKALRGEVRVRVYK
ncbi:MAG: MBL fold metallo-hydrolase [Proteobacteria bacterium]|nr:MBL fold metallo-hydrolase [Pseudomonadota bacterium]